MDYKQKRVGFLIERSYRITKLAFIKAFQKLDIDMTPNQYILMDIIQQSEGATQRELTYQTFKDPPTVSRIIENMVKKGWVKRVQAEDDRRKTLISLTETGESLLKQCASEIEELRRTTWHNLSEADYENFKRIMEQLFHNLENYSE